MASEINKALASVELWQKQTMLTDANTDFVAQRLARYAVEARLEEAKWWHDEIEGTVMCRDDKPCSYCQRIAALEAELTGAQRD